MIERVILIAPRGFCAGVVRAVETVERALAAYGPPVYVRRAIVHNPHVVVQLARAGAIFVEEVDEVPPGAVVVLSAHGVAPHVTAAATARGLSVIDAVCPLVTKVHSEARHFAAEGYEVVLIGHAGHDEVIGTLGQAPGSIHLVETVEDFDWLVVHDPARIACLTQTTLGPQDVGPVLAALHRRFPALAQPRVEDVCFATRNRQEAVQWLARRVDLVLVLGDQSSSNSRRLREVAAAAGTPSYLLNQIADLQPAWLEGASSAGITAGASTPEALIQEAAAYFRNRGATISEEALQNEQVVFALPSGLPAVPAGRAGGHRPIAV